MIRTWMAAVAALLLGGCGGLGSIGGGGSGPETVYSGKTRSYRGIEAEVLVLREDKAATTCSIDVEFINDTSTDSRFMTLAVRTFSPAGKLEFMELVRSSNIVPGGHNRVRMQDTGMCKLSRKEIGKITLELF